MKDEETTTKYKNSVALALKAWPKCSASDCDDYACRRHFESYFCLTHLPSGFEVNLPMHVLAALKAGAL